MNVVTRGIRNSFRNTIRTFSIVIILGLSVGLSLAMLVARQAVSQKIETVKSSVGSTINISPAGARGFEGGGEPLTTDQLAKVAVLPHITHLSESLNDRLTTSTTNLVSAIDAGSLGRRRAANSGISDIPATGDTQVDPNAANPTGRRFSFTPPVTLDGVSDFTSPTVYGGSTVSFISGSPIDGSKDINNAVVGKALAAKNNLSVGSTFTAYGTTITVSGIYDAGNTFANAGLIMSLPAVQRLSSQPNDITSAVATVDSVANVDSAASAISSSLGAAADVVSNADSAKNAIAPLENIKNVSLFSLLGAVIAGAVIILLTMIMIVRERRREIGVLKAIGASNIKVMFQFMSEAVTFTLLGAVVGLGLGAALASPITRLLVNNSTNSTATTGTATGGFGAGRGGAFIRALGGGNQNGVFNIRNIHAAAGWSLIVYGLVAAILIAIVGSAVSALMIAKIRPAEVMRAE